MAGLRQTTPFHSLRTTTVRRQSSSSKPPLPNGPCNYRDTTVGVCGCNQFWDKGSAELHEGSEADRPSSERSTWCVCGHHACFHLPQGHVTRAPTGSHYRATAQCDGRCRVHGDAQCDLHKDLGPFDGIGSTHNNLSNISQTVSASRLLQQLSTSRVMPGAHGPPKEWPSQASTSGLPPVPSVCLLSHDQRSATDQNNVQGRNGMGQTYGDTTGLGLTTINFTDRQQSITSTVPDDIDRIPYGSFNGSENHATRAESVRTDQEPITSPRRTGPLEQILGLNRNLQLDIGGDTIPNTYDPNDYIQSATEVATPSNPNTPDLGEVDQAVQNTLHLVETLTQLTSPAEQPDGQELRPGSATSAPRAATSQQQLQEVLRSAPPQTLQKVISYLAPLHSLLSPFSNVTTVIRELTARLDTMENASFNYVQPEEVQQQFEMYDGRMLELEHRLDDHERLHQAIDADQSSTSFARRRVTAVNESFGSNYSLRSDTSSALILAAIDRKDVESALIGIQGRLDSLEAAAMPTLTAPWEIEVVLLPWKLQGIWFSSDESMHDSSKRMTQDSEEWTQVRSKLEQQASLSVYHSASYSNTEQAPGTTPHGHPSAASSFSEAPSVWSSEAISEWAAGSLNRWLSPKACGNNNLVYKRLQSRGFVRNITLTSANSKDIQAALSTAFRSSMDRLRFTGDDEHPTVASYPGLLSAFIPLRKVLKESRLRFLTPAEVSNSALWSAQFLTSGVMMRVSGGKRRLYVTQREAYIQDELYDVNLWDWQQLRQLPRYQPDMDSQMEGNDEQCQPPVEEADAREVCWAFVEALDLPPVSVASSLSSHQSAPVELSMRPADRNWRRSITPSSILKNKQLQPLSPLSEFHSRPGLDRIRTVSASAVEQNLPGSSKRRLDSSPIKQSEFVRVHSRVPSVSIVRPKRRRVATSLSPHSGDNHEAQEHNGQVVVWNEDSRRRLQPLPSPFDSSHPELARTNSDAASRSQKSVAVTSKSVPFAYATPYSGPIGCGDYIDQAGDTEPDDDYQNDNDDDDGESSWPGVDDSNDNGSDDDDAGPGAQLDHLGSFSGDDNGVKSEDDESSDDEDEEDHDEVYDRLLEVLEGDEDMDDMT
jgi:hypothetical protein